MSEVLRRIAETMADVTEDEVVAALGSLGAPEKRERHAQPVFVTPLPSRERPSDILSEVEWV